MSDDWEKSRALVMDTLSRFERNNDRLTDSVHELSTSVSRIDASLKVWVVVVPLFISTIIGVLSIVVNLYMGTK